MATNPVRRRLVWLAALAAAAFPLWRAASGQSFSFDDAYITYRYAQNLAAGHGFVYNLGERVLGTTTPLYTLLLAALTPLPLDLPRISLALGGLAAALAVGLVWALGRRDGPPAAGLVAAMWLALDPLPYLTLGMETTLYLSLCLLALHWQCARRPGLAAAASGLAFLTRWDGVLVAAVVLLAEAARTRRAPWRAALVFAALAAPWLVFAQLYFGSIFPNTFFAKLGQASTGLMGGGAASFGAGLLHLAGQRAASEPLLWLSAFLLVGGIVRCAARPPEWWPVLAWAGLYAAGYIALGVANFHWYYAPLLPALALLLGSGLGALIERLAGTARGATLRYAPLVGGTLAAALLLWPQWRLGAEISLTPVPRMAAYAEVGQWLHDNSPPESSVALLEIGMVGYASQRRVVDMMGLVTPSMVGYLDNWDQVNVLAVTRHWPDYVLAGPALNRLAEDPGSWFARTYAAAAAFDDDADPANPLRLYARRPGFPPLHFDATQELNLVFDQSFVLARLELEHSFYQAGAPLAARLEWRPLAPTHSHYVFDFELVNLSLGTRFPLEAQSTPFYGGAHTALWQPGDALSEVRLWTWPSAAPPGAYRLMVRATHDGLEVMPSGAESGQPRAALSGVLVSGEVSAPDGLTDAPLAFAGGLRLLGYRLLAANASPVVELVWEAAAPQARAYTVFIHFLDAGGGLAAQHDSPPANGRLPMPWWGVGIPVRDPHPVAAPLAGIAAFCVGVYDPATPERLPILDGPGYELRDDKACRPLQ
jgi:hypothetical protein